MKWKIYSCYVAVLYVVLSCSQRNDVKNQSGKSIYKQYCTNCHGIDGSLMTNGAKDLRYSSLNIEEKILVITDGRNIMTAFGNTLTPAQIEEVAKYTHSFIVTDEK